MFLAILASLAFGHAVVQEEIYFQKLRNVSAIIFAISLPLAHLIPLYLVVMWKQPFSLIVNPL